MPPIRPSYVTEAAFLARPETMEKVELIDGELFSAPAPTIEHQSTLIRLAARLQLWQESNAAFEVFCAPIDVRFGPERILQPDIVVFGEPVERRPGPIDQTPSLCVEILSPSNRGYDLVTKRFIYAAAGVPEYWIIDPAGSAEVWRGPGLAMGAAVTEALESPRLPGFALPLSKLFAR